MSAEANSPHPRGATARCEDGSYSYSAHARGTCPGSAVGGEGAPVAAGVMPGRWGER
ncbi:DUF3761 domain-containing protein [Streptomyces sp. L7]